MGKTTSSAVGSPQTRNRPLPALLATLQTKIGSNLALRKLFNLWNELELESQKGKCRFRRLEEGPMKKTWLGLLIAMLLTSIPSMAQDSRQQQEQQWEQTNTEALCHYRAKHRKMIATYRDQGVPKERAIFYEMTALHVEITMAGGTFIRDGTEDKSLRKDVTEVVDDIYGKYSSLSPGTIYERTFAYCESEPNR
jgi:hypothetical protein